MLMYCTIQSLAFRQPSAHSIVVDKGAGDFMFCNEGTATLCWKTMSLMDILSANLWGVVSGKWCSTGGKPALVMGAVVSVLRAAVLILGWVDTFG